MANQVRDGWKELKHKYLQIESAKKKYSKSHNLSREPSNRYSCFPDIMYSHSASIDKYNKKKYFSMLVTHRPVANFDFPD
jgi:hypothetical protein